MDRTVETTELAGSFSGDLSMFGLFMQADMIVKAVIIILLIASIRCWAIIIEKRSRLKKLNTRARKFEDSFWSGEPLDKLYERVKKAKKDPLINTFIAGMEEWHSGVAGGVPSKESLQASLRQRVERAMTLTINREMSALE